MKKLGLLIVGAFLFTACDSTPGGNKGILPLEHDGIAEEVDHHAEGHEAHDAHATHEEDHAVEANDSVQGIAPAAPVEEPTDSAH